MNPDLAVCVSCKGLRPELCFQALARQTLPRWEAILLIPEKEKSLQKILRAFHRSFPPPSSKDRRACKPGKSQTELSAVTVLTGTGKNSLQNLRNQAFECARAPILLFIDEDVILENPDHFQNLLSLHEENPDIAVIGGAYLNAGGGRFSAGGGPGGELGGGGGGGRAVSQNENSPGKVRSSKNGSGKSGGLSFWGRAYNETTRLWTLFHPELSPAGNLSCKKALLNPAARFKSFGGFFGGEELHFFHQVKKTGGRCLRAEILDAPHCARHSFRDFVSRALCHGQARAAFAAALKKDLPNGRRPRRQGFSGKMQSGKTPNRPGFDKPLVFAAALSYLALVRLTSLFFSLSFFLKPKFSSNQTV